MSFLNDHFNEIMELFKGFGETEKQIFQKRTVTDSIPTSRQPMAASDLCSDRNKENYTTQFTLADLF